MTLPVEVAFAITTAAKSEEGGLVPIVVFFIFVAVVVLETLALGYGSSLFEDRTIGRRCRIPYEMYGRRSVQRQRVRCRFEGQVLFLLL